MEPGNDRGGVEHATEHITEHVTEHATQHGADEGGVSDYAVARYRWRSRASRRPRGEVWIPPDTRELHAPVFVPLADLTSAASSEGPGWDGFHAGRRKPPSWPPGGHLWRRSRHRDLLRRCRRSGVGRGTGMGFTGYVVPQQGLRRATRCQRPQPSAAGLLDSARPAGAMTAPFHHHLLQRSYTQWISTPSFRPTGWPTPAPR